MVSNLLLLILLQHLERASELSDAGLCSFFRSAMEVLQHHHGNECFQDMRLNHGTYRSPHLGQPAALLLPLNTLLLSLSSLISRPNRNLEHIHLKIWVEKSNFLAVWSDSPVFQAALRQKKGNWESAKLIRAVVILWACRDSRSKGSNHIGSGSTLLLAINHIGTTLLQVISYIGLTLPQVIKPVHYYYTQFFFSLGNGRDSLFLALLWGGTGSNLTLSVLLSYCTHNELEQYHIFFTK